MVQNKTYDLGDIIEIKPDIAKIFNTSVTGIIIKIYNFERRYNFRASSTYYDILFGENIRTISEEEINRKINS